MLEKTQKDLGVLRGSELDGVANVYTAIDVDKVIEERKAAFIDFLKKYEAEELEATAQDAGPVFEKYFASEPPFDTTKDKKSEFPDAFVVEALIKWTEDNGTDLFVVTGDEPFRDACDECDELRPLRTLAELLDHVAQDDEKLANFVRQEIKEHFPEIQKRISESFESLDFHVIDEWGDVEMEVDNVAFSEPEIIDLDKKTATVRLPVKIYFVADLTYDDSATGVYDSEDQRTYYLEQRNVKVRRKRDGEVEVRVLMDGTDPDAFEIEDVELTEPEKGFGIRAPMYPEDED